MKTDLFKVYKVYSIKDHDGGIIGDYKDKDQAVNDVVANMRHAEEETAKFTARHAHFKSILALLLQE